MNKKNICISIIGILLLVGIASANIPPNPTNLQSATSPGWVNWTWDAGVGNVTDSYRVLHNSVWDNTSSNAYDNNNVGYGNTSTIAVYAWNTSGSGNLSLLSVGSTQTAGVAAGMFSALVTLMEAIPVILAPVPAIIIVVIEIMAYMAVGALIVGIIAAVIVAINKGLELKRGMR